MFSILVVLAFGQALDNNDDSITDTTDKYFGIIFYLQKNET